MKAKALPQIRSKILPVARFVLVLVAASILGWIVGVTNLIADDHQVLSIIAPAMAGASLVGVVAVAASGSYSGGLWPSSKAWRAIVLRPRLRRSAAVPADEPSHIHIPRPVKGERA